jgi:hypothetical protein
MHEGIAKCGNNQKMVVDMSPELLFLHICWRRPFANVTTSGYPNSTIHCICDRDIPDMLDLYAPYIHDNGLFSSPCLVDHVLLDGGVQK